MDRRRPTSRSRALDSLAVLRGVPSPELRRTARLAAHIARQGSSDVLGAVHLLDDDFQHRVASFGGVPLTRTPVDDSMCVQVMNQDGSLYTSDATTEDRFADNPFTTGAEPVRLYYSTPLRLTDGTAIGTLCVFSTATGQLDSEQRDRLDDLAHQTGAHLEVTGLSRELAHLATHDPLTGLANRLLLSQRLQVALEDPERLPHEPAVLLLDLDDFKAINDTYGHQTGDEVLRSIADRLASAVRPTDLAARLGGDEYAVLADQLPDPARLDELAQRVATLVAAPHRTRAGEISCTVSIGRALGRPGDLAYELLGRADRDMYDRKHGSLPRQR